MKELHLHSLFLVLHWSHSVYVLVQELYYCTALDTTQFEGAVHMTALHQRHSVYCSCITALHLTPHSLQELQDSASLAPLRLQQLFDSTALAPISLQELYDSSAFYSSATQFTVQLYDSAALASLSLQQLCYSVALGTTQFTGAVRQPCISATPFTGAV